MPCVNFCRLKQLMDMKNEYKETSPEMLAMRESVTYYMQLTDYIMQEPALLNRHDKLCRLIITIAEDYPDSIAENRGKVLRFPKVMAGPTFGGKQEPEFEVFVTMFSNNVNYETSTGVIGDDVFFLTLSLWYEICRLRDLLRIDGIKFHRYEKDVNAAILEARTRKAQEALLQEQQRREHEIELLPHFRVQRSDEELLAILKGLQEVEWRNRNSRRVGVFADEVTEEEWLAAMRGPRDDSELKRKKIAWEAKYVCKSFVAQYLDGNYELAERVFCLAGGKEIKKLCDTNISKNKEMCDEVTGKIAQIIRAAMRK